MIIVVVCVVSALLGGWIGWRRGTSQLFARSFDPLQPAHGSGSSDSVRGELARRRRARVMTTFLYALAGPVVAIVVLLVLIRVR